MTKTQQAEVNQNITKAVKALEAARVALEAAQVAMREEIGMDALTTRTGIVRSLEKTEAAADWIEGLVV